jgi:Glycosyl hydrolases family 38 C-terminal domain/Glycosyl hydrolases family 38 N-terminal domain/Glycosyl hydrolases family 38 C-terminal beta sandwich domain/Alpha mannosidase middle domain
VSGESLIRNLQIGHRVAAGFGAVMKVGYLPDEFGHCAQMPQILAGVGIDCAVVWRGVGSDVTETLFTWEGLDGTRALAAYLPISGYSNGRNLGENVDELRAQLEAIIGEQAAFRHIPSLLVMNGTDHQEPQAGLPAALESATRALEGVTYEIAPLRRFVERARREHGELQTHRGELRSPLRTTVTPGVTSVRVRLKQRDFESVSRLERYAEPLATWADLLAGTRHFSAFLEWAWKVALQNHPHDSITGCSVDQVHRDMEARFDQVHMVVEQVTSAALAALIQRLDSSAAAPDAALVVYNPNAAAVHVVSAAVQLDGEPPYELVDAAGRAVALHVEANKSEVLLDAELPPADVRPHVLAMQTREFLGMAINDIRLERRGATLHASVTLDRMPRGQLDLRKLRTEWLAHLDDPTLRSVAVRAQTGVPARATFCAPHLTGHGFSVFKLQKRTAKPVPAPFAATDRGVENAFFHLCVNDDGSLQLTDKQTGLVLPKCNRFVDEGDRGDEYNFDPVEGQGVTAPESPPVVTVDADNPVVATLTVRQRYALPRCLEADRETRSADRVHMPITTVVRLYADVQRVDFETTLDNVAADHRLRVHFRTPLAVDSAFMEQAFATIERSLTLEPPSEFERAIGTVPQKTFTCIQDGERGVALFNRGIPEVEVARVDAGTEIALTLIRAVGWLSRGDLRFRHGPAGPGLETPEAQSLGRHRFEYALTTFASDWQTAGVVAQAHAFAFPALAAQTDAHAGELAADAALVSCDNPLVVLSALTPSQRPDGFVTRWYNSAATTQTADIQVPLALRARAVNFLESPSRANVRRVAKQCWRVQLRPFEIVTLQVKLPRRSPSS